MTTTMLSTAIVISEPMFSDAERVALGGYLAGYSGLTREAYALDLRQFAAWCEEHKVHLFEARLRVAVVLHRLATRSGSPARRSDRLF